jgi:hypothetical protein
VWWNRASTCGTARCWRTCANGLPDQGRPVGAAIEDADLDEVLARLPVGLQTRWAKLARCCGGRRATRAPGRGVVVRDGVRLVVLDEAFRGLETPRRRALLTRVRARWRLATLLFITPRRAGHAGFRSRAGGAGRRDRRGRRPRRAGAAGRRATGRCWIADRRVRARFAHGDWRHLVVRQGAVHEHPAAETGAGR